MWGKKAISDIHMQYEKETGCGTFGSILFLASIYQTIFDICIT